MLQIDTTPAAQSAIAHGRRRRNYPKTKKKTQFRATLTVCPPFRIVTDDLPSLRNHLSRSSGAWFFVSFPSADLLSLERQGVFGGAIRSVSVGPSTERIVDRSASASRRFRSLGMLGHEELGTQCTHGIHQEKDCYSTRDARLHSMAAHPIRS